MAHGAAVRAGVRLLLGAGVALGGVTALRAQVPPLTIELRGQDTGSSQGPVLSTTAGAGVTLVFRIANPADIARSVLTHVALPPGWQLLFATPQLDVPAQGSAVEMITISAPRNAPAGDYPIQYEARLTSSGPPVLRAVTVRINERHQLGLAWAVAASFLPSDQPGTFEFVLTNGGNVSESVTVNVRSSLAAPLLLSWAGGPLQAGEQRRVKVVFRGIRTSRSVRETLTATAAVDGRPATTEAALGFDVVPQGQAPDAPRHKLPAKLALRAGTGRAFGFGSFAGSGALGPGRSTQIKFGVVSRDRSHPLLFERDRNFLNVTGPGGSFAIGDQTWALSYLTESGHYGLGAGGRVERRHWSGGAFLDTGRRDVTEGSQAGAFLGFALGPVARISAHYLARFAGSPASDRLADIGSVRLQLRPNTKFSGEVEAGIGRSLARTGRALSTLLSFNSRRVSLYGRRVRKDDAYPLRDRTGLVDGAGVSLRPFGHLHVEGTLDGTGQIDDPTLPLDAPTRQRLTRARVSWGSWVSVSAGRTEWNRPGRNWSAQWRRESVTAELHIPVGRLWLAPGVERGTEATPSTVATPYSLSWLQAGIRMGGRSGTDVRLEYGRGAAGNANQVVRRISFGATLQPIDTTRLTVRMSNGARDAVWLQGAQSVNAVVDQRLPWRHHLVVTYLRRTGAGDFVKNDEAYRVEYVIPIGVPVRTREAAARLTVRVTDGESGKPLERMLVHVKGQSRLTDDQGVVVFVALSPGEYHVTVSPDSIGAGRTLMPGSPLQVSVKTGDRAELSAVVVRSGRVTGSIQKFESAASPAGTGIGRTLIELVINNEHRTTLSDPQGRFSFPDVPPGAWRIRVVRADVPAFYYLEQPHVSTTVVPGGTSLVVFRVLPKPVVVHAEERPQDGSRHCGIRVARTGLGSFSRPNSSDCVRPANSSTISSNSQPLAAFFRSWRTASAVGRAFR
jgi:hypothetical protein